MKFIALVVLSLFIVPSVFAANVLHRTTKRYLRSVNTPDFPVAEWIINPDLSAVQGLHPRYWKIVGDTVTPMPQAERDVVNNDRRSQMHDRSMQGLDDTFEVWSMAILELLSEINKDRPLGRQISETEFKAAVRARLGN